jgi:hypothetical protein
MIYSSCALCDVILRPSEILASKPTMWQKRAKIYKKLQIISSTSFYNNKPKKSIRLPEGKKLNAER